MRVSRSPNRRPPREQWSREPATRDPPPRESSPGERSARRRHTPEQSLLWTVTIALFAAGAGMVYSASSATSALSTDGDPLGYLKRYLVLGGLGLLAMRYTSLIDLDRLRKLTPAVVTGA